MYVCPKRFAALRRTDWGVNMNWNWFCVYSSVLETMRYCSVLGCLSTGETPNIIIHSVIDSWQSLNCWKSRLNNICSLHVTNNACSSQKRFKYSVFPTLNLSSMPLSPTTVFPRESPKLSFNKYCLL